ncbi:MAG: Na+/H+ antiporter NhaC [Bryobacterales bacterium]|nr:Na+/H+ antiporter NhaC [Acidobacteriota bacterium]MCB9385910.1 Na+/H+ antiporter NhaC [Bryobacterales bacterium]
MPERPAPGFAQALPPILVLSSLIVYGLVARPLWLDESAFPLEVIFGLSAGFTIAYLFRLGYRWDEIQASIVRKFARGLPAFFILMAIGVIISSWMICGALPMLVYYGLRLLNPDYIYLTAFLVPVVFSSLTGTSWGSAGTVGVVVIGIASALRADLGITAGAVIGGAFFGDKLSPLSDTTNMAALASDVDLFDHIRSMLVTTIPSALLAAAAYLVLGFLRPAEVSQGDMASVEPLLASLREMFRFNPLLLLPPAIILYGSLRKLPTIPTLLASVFSAVVLALAFQRFAVGDVMLALTRGFDASMASWMAHVPEQTAALVNRGGLYAMNEAVFIAFLVFFFIGALDVIHAMPTVVNRIFSFASTRRDAILSALVAGGVTNALTSNQYATSFIVGDAFRERFDRLRIPRKVLSRSIEDWGTMIESVIPWHATSVFMVAALGVPYAEYAPWQLLTLINLAIAPLFAIFGIGCFYDEEEPAP